MAPEIAQSKSYGLNIDIRPLGIAAIKMVEGIPLYLDDPSKVLRLLKEDHAPCLKES